MEMDHTIQAGGEPVPQRPRPLIPWGWLRALLFLMAATVAQVVGQLLVSEYFSPEGGFFANILGPHMALLQFSSITLTLLVMWAFTRWIDRRPLVSFGFQLHQPFPSHLVAGVGWGAGTTFLVFVVLWLTDHVAVVDTGFTLRIFGFLLLSIIFAAAQEEIMLRGYILNNLMKSANRWLALVLSSLVFALFHAMNPNVNVIALINILLAGLFIGVYYMHRQNLWLPISMHFAWNFMQGPILGSPVSGIDIPSILQLEFSGSDLITGGAFGFEASLVTSVTMVVGTIGLHLVYRKRPAQERAATSPALPAKLTP